jgi:choline dehydrogenase-like flavoprotein
VSNVREGFAAEDGRARERRRSGPCAPDSRVRARIRDGAFVDRRPAPLAAQEGAAQGRNLGGGTTVNWTSSFRTPPRTLGCGLLDPRRAVVTSRGRHHQLENLWITDGSVFPTALGVNPQLSIYAHARLFATEIARAG